MPVVNHMANGFANEEGSSSTVLTRHTVIPDSKKNHVTLALSIWKDLTSLIFVHTPEMVFLLKENGVVDWTHVCKKGQKNYTSVSHSSSSDDPNTETFDVPDSASVMFIAVNGAPGIHVTTNRTHSQTTISARAQGTK